MKKNYFISIVLFFSLINIYSQSVDKIKGNKIVETKIINIENFKLLEVGEEFDVILFEQATPKVLIEADSNLHDFIVIDVDAEKLTVRTSKTITKSKKLSLEIGYTGDLSQIIVNGKVTMRGNSTLVTERTELIVNDNAQVNLNFKSSRVEIKGSDKSKINSTIEAESVAITGNNSSDLFINMNTESLNISLAEDSELKISGITAKANLFLQDNSHFSGGELDTGIGVLSTKNKSKSYIKVTDKLSLTASETSETYLIGNPIIEITAFNDFPKLEKVKKVPSNWFTK